MTETRKLRSIDDVKTANANAGHFFFSKDTMRFFRSRVNDDFYPTEDGGGYFITSEQFVQSNGIKHPRRYTVRKANANGTIAATPSDDDTILGFQRYATLEGARRAIRDALEA